MKSTLKGPNLTIIRSYSSYTLLLQEDQAAFLKFAHLLEATGQNDEMNYHFGLEKPSISFLGREVDGKIEFFPYIRQRNI